jgi:hypothetical protein
MKKYTLIALFAAMADNAIDQKIKKPEIDKFTGVTTGFAKELLIYQLFLMHHLRLLKVFSI